MNLRECLYLLPGHGLDDFPRVLSSDEADALLAGWIALWHPNFINACRTTPRWQQAAYPPVELNDLLIVFPSVSDPLMRTNFNDEVTQAGGMLRAARGPWQSFQDQLLSDLGLNNSNSTIDALRTDFAALGYAYLQVQLMTRQLRYSSNLDELLFADQALQAAMAAIEGDSETANRLLQSCFDQLGQERDHYYSLDVNLIDVTLLAPTTLGASLKKQLAQSMPPTSILASASLLRTMNEQHPESLAAVRAAIEQNHATIMGGLDQERPHGVMTFDTIRRDLMRARLAYEQLGTRPPKVFARYSSGMSSDLSIHLRRSGFVGAMLIAWETGTYPQGSQAKISWEASDGTFIAALAPKVIDAADASNFLTFGLKAGEALDREQVPTIVLAHWPNRVCEYYRLLLRITARTPAIGKWILSNEYFENTDLSYHQERFTSNHFQQSWFTGAIALTPAQLVERVRDYHQLHARVVSLQNLANLVYQLDNYHRTAPQAIAAEAEEPATPEYAALPVASWAPAIEEALSKLDAFFDLPSSSQDAAASEAFFAQRQSVQTLLDQQSRALLGRLAKHLAAPQATVATDSAEENARLVFNPYASAMRLPVQCAGKQVFTPESGCLFAIGSVDSRNVSLVDVPQFGFVIGRHAATSVGKTKQRSLVEVGGLLQNEFFEVQVDSQRGHLRSLHVPGKRGNRFSFSIAKRDVQGGVFQYSEMQADRVETIVSSNVRGVVRASGQLVENGKSIGRFQIDFSAWRGSRVLEVDVKLSDVKAVSGDPWRSAYVLRFAWASDAALVRTYGQGARESFSSGVAIAPALIEIDEVEYRTQLLTGGLAFHRRVENRFLESILATEGMSAVSHRFGIAVDLPYPQQTASQFMDSPLEIGLKAADAMASKSSWLFSVDAKSARLDLECPLVSPEGLLIGQRLRVSETENKTTIARIRCSRDVAEAHRVDHLGGRIGKLTAEGDCCTISLRANERVLVDVLWQLNKTPSSMG